jgi:hypothetical protein
LLFFLFLERESPAWTLKYLSSGRFKKTKKKKKAKAGGWVFENAESTTVPVITREISEANKRPLWQFGVV